MAWRKANPTYHLEWRRANPRKTFAAQLKHKFGLTLEQWDAMVVAQCGRCASCGDPMTRTNEPCVDHDHETGKVRELLCHPCNSALGLLKESLLRLGSLASYVLKHQRLTI